MIGAILFIAILIFGIQILFGAGKIEYYYKFLVWLIFAPILLAIGINHALWFWYGWPLWLQIVSIAFLPFLVAAVLRRMFPKSTWINSLQSFLFEFIVHIAAFPFRLIYRMAKFFLGRERRSTQLYPYRPVVGSSPPLERPAETKSKKSSLFD